MDHSLLHNNFVGYWIVTFLISYEAVMWGWTLNRHGRWQSKHPSMDKRANVSSIMLQMAAGMSAAFSLSMWFLFMYTLISSLHYAENPNFWIFVRVCILVGIQLTHVHFCAIIARYACLPRSMWPTLSMLVSVGLCKIFKIKPPVLTSFEVHECYKKKCISCNSSKELG